MSKEKQEDAFDFYGGCIIERNREADFSFRGTPAVPPMETPKEMSMSLLLSAPLMKF